MTLSLAFVLAVAPVKVLPTFSLKATDGKVYKTADLLKRHTLVVFFANGCPHNPKAATDMNRIKVLLGKDALVLGFINLKVDQAAKVRKSLNLSFPLIGDAGAGVMHGFGASHSLDMALVNPRTKNFSLAEGYNRTIVSEMLKRVRGTEPKSSEVAAFPVDRVSGCGF